MNYTVKFQSPASYSGNWYKYNTIGKSGCGPASVCNALKNAGIADVTVPAMCTLAINCGARVDGGTVMNTLLNACKSKYNITYKATSKNTELIAHLKAGGTAVCWCGGGYPLFSDSGHFVAAVGLDSNGSVYIADSLYYDGKWTKNSTRKTQIKPTSVTGLVRCSITALGKATADRSPSYYLISKTNDAGKDIEDMTETEVRALIDKVAEEKANKVVSSWAADAWEKAKKAGLMDGTMPRGNLTREQFAAIMDRLGLLDGQIPKVYKTIKDVPSYYRDAVQKMIDCGAISGTGNGEINLSSDICRAFTILDNAGLLETEFSDEEVREKNYSK